MSKTTPEEAARLARKHGFFAASAGYDKLAALIDEARGVDAEPVGYRWKWDDGILDAAHPLAGWQIGNVLPDIHPANKDHITVEAVYTHPAPSQPAAPVELPVVAWFADDGDSQGLALKENIALRSCEPGTMAEALVKLSDAQAAVAAGRKAS